MSSIAPRRRPAPEGESDLLQSIRACEICRLLRIGARVVTTRTGVLIVLARCSRTGPRSVQVHATSSPKGPGNRERGRTTIHTGTKLIDVYFAS